MLLLLITALPLVAYSVSEPVPEAPAKANVLGVVNPGALLWRGVRQSEAGRVQASGMDTGVLIDPQGMAWIERNRNIKLAAAWLIPITIALILLFYLIRGKIRIDGGPSGQRIKRWSLYSRLLHAYTAILFVVLLVTGFSLSFGRMALIPLLGKEGFSAYAGVAKLLHNYLGPAFAVGVLLMLLSWIRHNLPGKGDLTWLAQGGGIFGHQHPPAGRFNAGEKLWFWWIASFGVLACVSGLVLNFPIFPELTRENMQLANTLHLAAAAVWSLFFFGHAYIGSIGTEGAWEAMKTGHCDLKWAEQHHNLWVEDLRKKGEL